MSCLRLITPKDDNGRPEVATLKAPSTIGGTVDAVRESPADLLDQADHLLHENFPIAAGMTARMALEVALRDLCHVHACPPPARRRNSSVCTVLLAALRRRCILSRTAGREAARLWRLGSSVIHCEVPAADVATIRRLLDGVRAFVADLAAAPEDPLAEAIVHANADQLDRILAICDRQLGFVLGVGADRYWRAVVRLIFDTTITPAEVLRLRVDDVNLQDRTLQLDGTEYQLSHKTARAISETAGKRRDILLPWPADVEGFCCRLQQLVAQAGVLNTNGGGR